MSTLTRDYEAILMVRSDLEEEALTKVQAQFAEVVTRHGGRVLQSQSLGRQKLAYRIGKFNEGIALQLRLQMDPSQLPAIEKGALLIEPLLRLIVIHGRDDGQSQ
ncbi:MAG: 30S ribosomal protein S6 [Candidatus Omnitrophica bacterium]|nr:30S ribosomal protein S6 [Candidatus Omnitrophota bacterium]